MISLRHLTQHRISLMPNVLISLASWYLYNYKYVFVLTATAMILSTGDTRQYSYSTIYSQDFLDWTPSHLTAGGQLSLLDRQVKGSWVDG